ncbi:hypothetical protein DFH07DRAFT_861321, partial [Mycena maculata]
DTAAVLSEVMTAEMDDEEEILQEPTEVRASDLYLDRQINRCARSRSRTSISGCLVCGKYFQGRGRSSYAYSHSIHEDHHVYVLPDGYPVSDPSLEDISFVLAPSFSPTSIATLSSPAHLTKLNLSTTWLSTSGYVGLNNIKRNDHMNYLLLSNFRRKESELLKRFAGLAKKLWNPKLFKSQVSPHEFRQEVNRASAGKFRLEQQGDSDTGGTKRRNSRKSKEKPVLIYTPTVSPFLFLAKNIIPRVSIHSVLGTDYSMQKSAGQLKRYKCQRLPPYVILHFMRFTKNAFAEEKNPKIVNFPLHAPPSGESTVYDLIANVTHESVAGTTRDKENTVWTAHLHLIVEDARKEMIFLGETVLYRSRDESRGSTGAGCR